MAAHKASGANGSSLEMELNDIMSSNARHAAALCAAACQSRVEEARREERARILAQLKESGQSVPALGPTSWEEAAWTRGFFDEKLIALCPAPPSRSRESSRGSAYGVDPAILAIRGEAGGDLEIAEILRNAFAIREQIHAAVASSHAEPVREQRVRTCDIKTIVGKVHALWQDKLLEDSDDEHGPSTKSAEQATGWKSASEKPAGRRASCVAPRRPSSFMADRVGARRRSGEGAQALDLNVDGLAAAPQLPDNFAGKGSRQSQKRLSCPPAMSEAMRGLSAPAERAFAPSLDRIEDVAAETSLSSPPRASPVPRSQAPAAEAAPQGSPTASGPGSPATVRAPRSPGQNSQAEGSTDLGRTLAELTALLQDANIIGPTAGTATGQS